MRNALVWFVLLAVASGVLAAVLTRSEKGTTATPTHAVAVFVDGINHGDIRETCSVWLQAQRHMRSCEAGLTAQLGEAAASGEFGGYRVIARSAREWRQAYRGRVVSLATVRVVYAPSGGAGLTARLVERDGRWLVEQVA